MAGNKLTIGKYAVLHKILKNNDFERENQQAALKFSLKGVEHNLQDVRNLAYKCIIELYRQMGPKIRGSLGNLKKAQMEQLETAFAEIDGVDQN